MEWKGTFTQWMIVFTLILICILFYAAVFKNVIRLWNQKKTTREGFMDYADPIFNIPATLPGGTTSSSTYLATMKAYKQSLTDMFGLSTPNGSAYRKNYEDIIVTLEDILGLMALQITLSIDVNLMTQQQIVYQMTKIGQLIEAQIILSKFIYPIVDKL